MTTSRAFILALLAPLSLAGAQTTTHHAPTHTQSLPAAKPCLPGEAAPVTPAGVPTAAGPVQTAFALRYIDMQPGTGEVTAPGQFLTVHYTGWLAADGTKFDSSLDRGQPITFQQGAHRVIPGWDQGFAGMKVGGKRRLFIPYELAYGEDGRPPVIPAKSDLIFDIELVAAGDTPPAPAPAPAQATAPTDKPATQPNR